MKANTDQHNTIQNTFATVFKREYSCCHLVSNLKAEWKENEKGLVLRQIFAVHQLALISDNPMFGNKVPNKG